MLDIKVIRENADRVKAAMKSRNMDADQVIESILQMWTAAASPVKRKL